MNIFISKGSERVLTEKAFLVSETDDFCEAAGYRVDDLIGKPHNIVRHPDMPRAAFKDLWDTVKAGKIWTGYVKNATKNGGFYWVYATVYPNIGCDSDGKCGYLSCRRKPSSDEIAEAERLYRTMN